MKINEFKNYKLEYKDEESKTKLFDRITALTMKMENKALYGSQEETQEAMQNALIDCRSRAEVILQLLMLYDDLNNGGTEAEGDWIQALEDANPGCIKTFTKLTELPDEDWDW